MRLKEKAIWQQFTYREFLDRCYSYEKIEQILDTCGCMAASVIDVKPVYGPWIRVARVPVNATANLDNRSSLTLVLAGEKSDNTWTQPWNTVKKSPPKTQPMHEGVPDVGDTSKFAPLMSSTSEDPTDPQQMEITKAVIKSWVAWGA